jgi:hypothetical protein
LPIDGVCDSDEGKEGLIFSSKGKDDLADDLDYSVLLPVDGIHEGDEGKEGLISSSKGKDTVADDLDFSWSGCL